MSKLIIVSNRVAVPDGRQNAGGLAVALEEALKEKGGIWCGWSGELCDDPQTHRQTTGNVDYVTQDLTVQDHEAYYLGFSNSMLWPLFHYRIGLTTYTQEMFEGYERVNRGFASLVAREAGPDDIIWVHDYHFLTLGAHLREEKLTNLIGFFLHIPFPVPEVLTALPVYQEIIRALCQYDLVGFQTHNDLQSFVRCVTELGGQSSGSPLQKDCVELQAFGRSFRAGCFPISIDTEEMATTAELAENSADTLQLKQSLNGHPLMIGVDRLDYTKGIPQRLEAFDHFLSHYPDYLGKASYLQITPPSRTDIEEYQDLREEVEQLAARINGRHAGFDWTPIRYLNKSFTREQLAGFYRTARVGMVTPLRDGMNLVAKEYVASQDIKDPGVLILSQFAGAASELEAALIVNPHDSQSMGEAIANAFAMPLIERRERYVEMMKVLRRNDIFAWRKSFLALLTQKEEPILIGRTSYKRQLESREPVAMM